MNSIFNRFINKKDINDPNIPVNDMIPGKVYFIDKHRISLNTEDGTNVYTQDQNKVEMIKKSMFENGYDPSQVIILNSNLFPIDGKSRTEAAMECDNVTLVPVMIKEMSATEQQLYQYQLQLTRRNLSTEQRFISFCQREKLRGKVGIEHVTDDELAMELQTSPRTIQKMREVYRKTDEENLQKIMNGELSLNQAYNILKKFEKLSLKKNIPEKVRIINQIDFLLGVNYTVLKLREGISPKQILNSDLIKSRIKNLKLTEDEKVILDDIRNTSEVLNGESRE